MAFTVTANTSTGFSISAGGSPPNFDLNGYRFYADGTESGSSALAAADTPHTADISGGDVNLGLRVRIQETNGGDGSATDDYKLQYNLNSGGWLDTGSGSGGGTDTYAFNGTVTDPNSAWLSDANIADGNQATFAGTTTAGSSSSNYIQVVGTAAPTTGGTITQVRARANYDDGSTALWTSYVTLSAPSGGWSWAEVDALELRVWKSGFGAGTAAIYESGNAGGTALATITGITNLLDEIYVSRIEVEVTSSASAVNNYNSTNLTDGGATTERLVGASGSFVAGEVSEDGTVDDLQITANNFTELLYSITLVSSELVDTDTLDFRVLRNNAVLEAYLETPSITISSTGGGNTTLTADAGTVTITGTAASLERNLKVVASAGSYAITGTAANLEYNRKVVADTGTFLITGTDANLESSREVFAESGSVIITGTDATLRKSINMTADSGSFAVTGTNALLTATRRLTASSGSVAITGTDASFRKSINFIAESGAFSVAGTNANLEYNRRLVADSGVFDITGTNASLESSREVFAESGSVAISGTSASLTVHRRMTANSGSYSILGTAVNFELARRLLADSGTVEITGTDATLDYQQGYFLTAESGSVVITGTPTRVTFDVIPTIQGRSYYIDSNGSVYWIISESIGLVEKV